MMTYHIRVVVCLLVVCLHVSSPKSKSKEAATVVTTPKVLEVNVPHYCMKAFPFVYGDTKSWLSAQSKCESYNGSLAQISTPDLLHTARNLFGFITNYFIGLSFSLTSYQYEWKLDGSVLIWDNWADSPGHGGCTYASIQDGHSWYKVSCYTEKSDVTHYVCHVPGCSDKVTTQPPSTTPIPTTSEPQSTTQILTTSQPPSTTQIPTTSQPPSTTQFPSTTQPPSITQNPSTFQPPRTTQIPTTSQPPSNTQIPTTSQPTSTTQIPTTPQPPSTAQIPTTSEPPSTNQIPTTSEPPSITQIPTTSEPPSTTQIPNISEPPNATLGQGISQPPSITHSQGITQSPSITQAQGTTQLPNNTQAQGTTQDQASSLPSNPTPEQTTNAQMSTTQGYNDNCPSPYTEWTEGSVSVCLMNLASPGYWTTTENECQKHNGVLFMVKNETYLNILTNFTRGRFSAGDKFWIGLKREHSTLKLDYIWSDDTYMTWTNWNPGYPTRRAKRQGSCVLSTGSGLWEDDACYYRRQLPAVCQYFPNGVVNIGIPTAQPGPRCMLLVNESMTFENASATCAGHGSHLFFYNDVNTYNRLMTISSIQSWPDYWLGFSDAEVETQFRSVTGEYLLMDIFKSHKLPAFDKNTNCLAANGSDHKAKPVSCDESKPFFCSHQGCPEGTNYHRVAGICTKLIVNADSFDAASRDCSEHGATLLFIKNETHMTETYDLYQNISTITNSHTFITRSDAFWIGLNISGSGMMQWLDSEPVTYDNWLPPRPISGTHLCGAVSVKDDWKWIQKPCSESLPYICQIPVVCTDLPSEVTTAEAPQPTTESPATMCMQSDTGTEYRGTISFTRGGIWCQRWDWQYPHGHTKTDPDDFPDDSLFEAGNFCRNPDGKEEGPWCYTVNPDRRWDFCDVPQCTPKPVITCPQEELASGTQRDTEDNTIGTIVTFYCNVGYKFPDGSTVRTVFCQSPGVWSSHTLPQCQAVLCQEPASLSSPDPLNYGKSQIRECSLPDRLVSGQTALKQTCTSAGMLVPPALDCAERCPPVPFVDAADANSTVTDKGVIVTFTCHVGHRFPDGTKERTIHCDGAYSWSEDVIPACLIITCPVVQMVSHSTANTTLALYGTVVQFQCNTGYRFHGNVTTDFIWCQDSGVWSRILPNCQEIDCGNPVTVPGSSSSSNGTKLWDIYTYTCHASLRFSDGTERKVIQCGVEQTWNDTGLNCQAGRCPPVPARSHITSDTILAEPGTMVTYTCNTGYTLPTDQVVQTLHCTPVGSSATWNPTLPDQCTAIQCPLPALSPHLVLSNDTTSYGTILDVTCEPGYYLKGGTAKIQTQCFEDREWNPPLNISCKIVECQEVLDLQNATADSWINSYNNSVTYSCTRGHQFTDGPRSKKVTCLASGKWSEVIKDCQSVTCPVIPTWDNLICDGTVNVYRSRVNCSCEAGYKSTGQSVISVCSEFGEWEPQLPQCSENTMADLGPPEEAPKATNIGTAAIVFISIVALSMCLLDLLTLHRHIHASIKPATELEMDSLTERKPLYPQYVPLK